MYRIEFAKLHPLSSNYKMMNKINLGTKLEHLCSVVFVDVVEFVRQVMSLAMLITERRIREQGWMALQKRRESVWVKVLGCVKMDTQENVRWEYVDLGEFCLRTAMDNLELEGDAEKLVVLLGFEVSQAKKNNTIIWAKCYGRYTVAMAQQPSHHAFESWQCLKCMKRLKIRCGAGTTLHLGRRWPQGGCST